MSTPMSAGESWSRFSLDDLTVGVTMLEMIRDKATAINHEVER